MIAAELLWGSEYQFRSSGLQLGGLLTPVLRKRLAGIAKVNILVIDDFAIAPMGARERIDLLDLLDDRVGVRATLLTSQLPIENWHDYIGDPTLADPILDRLMHSAHKIHLEGRESMQNTPRPAPRNPLLRRRKLTERDRSV